MVAGILATYGYDAELSSQSVTAVEGIKLSVSVYAAIPFLLCVAAVLFLYSIDKRKETEIENELMVRRAVKVEL